VFSTQDKKLQKAWKINSGVKRVFNKEIKGYIYAVDGDKGMMQIPSSDKSTLYLSKYSQYGSIQSCVYSSVLLGNSMLSSFRY